MPIQKFFLITLLCGFCLELSAQQFDEVSLASGIEHRQVFVGLMGGGVALFDYDLDGDIDMYLTGGSKPDKLFRNNGHFLFEDVSDSSGITVADSAKTMGVAAGDLNNDGFQDLFITTTEDSRNLLLLNNGHGVFNETSLAAGITDSAFSISATLGDYDLDGFLDIYVANYVKTPAFLYDAVGNVIGFDPTCYRNFLYRNNGDNTFSEIANIIGANDEGCGLATAFTDFDSDSDPDIYIANDFGEWHVPNTLLANRFKQDSFEDISSQSGADGAIYGMGVAIGDYDEDGDLDYYVTNLGRNLLLQNSGNGTFVDVTSEAGVEDTFEEPGFSVGWGTAFLDYDNDSYLDLIVNNGEIPTFDFLANGPLNGNRLYRNNQGMGFQDVSETSGFNSPWRGRGLAYGDLDNDGDLDVVSTVVERYPTNTIHTQIYKNNTSEENNWLKLQMVGTKSNRDGFGAHITIFSKDRKLLREVDGGSSHVSHNSSIVHFGLGKIAEVDSAIITWPGGNVQRLGSLNVNSSYTIAEESSHIVLDGAICTESAAVIRLEGAIIGNEYFLKNLLSQEVVFGPVLCEDGIVNLTTEESIDEIAYSIYSHNPEQDYTSILDSVIVKNKDFNVAIIEEGGTLKATDGTSFLWYLNDERMENTDRQITPAVSGMYRVEAINEYGCASMSESVNIVITALNENENEQDQELKIYPNPSNGVFRMQFVQDHIKEIKANVYDMLGKELRPKITIYQSEIVADLSAFQQGVYLININYGDTAVKKVLIKK
ncbi:MAG: FG-GAP-like repeat-containing protein [Cyclobacteriaceae bacterium]